MRGRVVGRSPAARQMGIGDLARSTGVSVAAIRYYEEIRLLPTPPRTSGNRRTYDGRDVERLTFIRNARDLGFELDAVRQLLVLAAHPEVECDGADEIARRRLDQVTRKISLLRGLKRELETMVKQGEHGTIGECRVMQALSARPPAASLRRRAATGSALAPQVA